MTLNVYHLLSFQYLVLLVFPHFHTEPPCFFWDLRSPGVVLREEGFVVLGSLAYSELSPVVLVKS